MKTRTNHDIRNLLSVLTAAIICAGLLSFVFLYYYGPSGRYLAGNTLLDPTIIEQIHYQDIHPQKDKKVPFVFDHIEFSYFDPQKGPVVIPFISMETYQKFYKMTASEKSLETVPQHIQDLFLKSQPSFLTIQMHSGEKLGNHMTKVFQIVQFVPEDYFRVQLHQKKEGEWVYFYRAGFYQDMMHLFTSSSNL